MYEARFIKEVQADNDNEDNSDVESASGNDTNVQQTETIMIDDGVEDKQDQTDTDNEDDSEVESTCRNDTNSRQKETVIENRAKDKQVRPDNENEEIEADGASKIGNNYQQTETMMIENGTEDIKPSIGPIPGNSEFNPIVIDSDDDM